MQVKTEKKSGPRFETIDDVADELVRIESENRYLRLALFVASTALVVSMLVHYFGR